MTTGLENRQMQTQTLAPQMRQGLKMLAMNLPELRAELLREMSTNPVIDDIDPTLEHTTVSEKQAEFDAGERPPDYPDDYDPSVERAQSISRDSDEADRRQRFFDSQTKDETLEEHLQAQLPFADIAPEDLPLAEMLIGDLNDDGRFAGSLPDLVMVSGCPEEKVRAVLAKIMDLDPTGCGATSLRECLLAQIDKLDGSPSQYHVVRLIEDHLADIEARDYAKIERSLGITRAQFRDALVALRTLDPRPGRAYRRAGRGTEYVNPEVHAVRCSDGWLAQVDARSLPTIHISQKYVKLLNDPTVSPETKKYVRERIAAANALIEAVEHRQETVTAIAQAIFDAQPGFFADGLKGLRPLTMQEIADKVGVHHTTVSRTVNDKYASTPKGTVELRKFFVQGVTTAAGESVARDRVTDRLREIVAAEDPAHPLSDEQLSVRLKAEGFPVARRTVVKYRGLTGIPSAAERRRRS